MSESHDYYVELRHIGDARGELSDSEHQLPPLEVAPPPQFGGRPGVWSPEHLFVASVAACLMTTFQAIASISRLDFLDYTDRPSGHLIKGEDGRYRLESVTLRPRVVVESETKADRARRLLDKAKEVCLISRSIGAKVQMEPTVEVAGV